MKKFTRMVVMATGFVLLLLSSCNSAVSNAIVESTSRSTAVDRTVTFNVTSNSNLINFASKANNNSRSILPTAYTVGNLWFYYTYKKLPDGTVTNAEAITVTGTGNASDTKTGSVIINLEAAQYEFTMYAIKKSTPTPEASAPAFDPTTDKDKIVLKGNASADIRTSDTVNFFMTAEGLTGHGTTALKLYTSDWTLPAGYDVTANLKYTKDIMDPENPGTILYHIDSVVENSEVTLKKDAGANPETDPAINSINDSAPTTANYAPGIHIAPGTYNFTIYFTDKNNSENKFEWSDRIIILPGQVTNPIIGIPNVIGAKPTKPESLKVSYIDPDNAYTGYYTGQFNWTDSSNNEKFFELQVVEFKADNTLFSQPVEVPNTTADDTEWDKLLDDYNADSNPTGKKHLIRSNITYGTSTSEVTWVTPIPNTEYKVFYGHPDAGYIDGALTKNNTVARMYLQLGSRYIARIRAVNAGGASDWTYATLDLATGDLTADANSGRIAASKFTSSTINRYRVNYALVGGAFYTKGTPNDTLLNPQPNTVFYYCQNNDGNSTTTTDGIAVMKADGSTDFVYNTDGSDTFVEGKSTKIEKPLIKYNDKLWSTWKCEFHSDGSDSTNSYYNEDITEAAKRYTGCANITFTASYQTVGSVTLFDDNEYAIGTIESNEPFAVPNGADSAPQNSLEQVISETNTKENLVWTINYPSKNAYESVSIQIVSTDGKKAYYLQNPSYDANGMYAKFTIPYKTYGEGIYNAKILAYTRVKPKDPYQKTIVLNITQN